MTQAEQNLLLKMVEQMRDDLAVEREAAHSSRLAVHHRLDEVVNRIGHLDTTAALAGAVDAQVRNELDKLSAKVDANHAAIAPSVDEWKRIRRLGLGIVGLMTAGGITVGAMVQWIVNSIWSWWHIH